MRESLTEKGGQQLLRVGKKTHLGEWGMCLQSFAGAMSFVCLADFGFNADKNSNNDNENSEDNVERQFINLTCDFRFFSPGCLFFLLTLKAD